MCLDCGCGELNESHGDSRHITMDSIQSAAQASEISVEEAIRNISDGLRQAQGSSGQSSASLGRFRLRPSGPGFTKEL